MASTRYRSRIRDANCDRQSISTVQVGLDSPKHTARDAAFATPDTDDDINNKNNNNIEDQLVHGRLSSTRATKGFCHNCGSLVGEFYNSWYKITGSHYLPTLLGSYKSLLRPSGKLKAASQGTALENCTIQPLSCPATSCTDLPIGFTVIETPNATKHFRGRDFFKLNRIELRCDTSDNTTIVVEPWEDSASETLGIESLSSPWPEPTISSQDHSPDTMDIDRHAKPFSHNQHNTVGYGTRGITHASQIESIHPPLPPPTATSPGATVSSSTVLGEHASARPARTMSQDVPYTVREPLDKADVGISPGTPPSKSGHRLSDQKSQINGHQYPKSLREVGLDAIERLQTQISQNSGALAAHTRDIRRGEESFLQLEETLRRDFQAQLNRQSNDLRRMEDAVARLHVDMQGIHQMVEVISRELHLARTGGVTQLRVDPVPQTPTGSAQDSALELMAQQIAAMSQKVNEIDNLKLTSEIIKNKIQRLEGNAPHGSSQAVHRPNQPQATEPSQHAHPPYPLPTHHTAPASQSASNHADSQYWHPSNGPNIPAASAPTASITTDAAATRPDPAKSFSGGWATINAGAKRSFPNGPERTTDPALSTPSSPKRRRTEYTENGNTSTPTHGHVQSNYAHDHYGLPEQHHPPPVHVLSSQQAQPDAAMNVPVKQAIHHPNIPHDDPSDDNFHQHVERSVEHRPRGRGRGGGPGSRGGRGRKSLSSRLHGLGTSDWDQNSWQDFSTPQGSPHEHYHSQVARSARGIARRGSGGSGGRGGYAVNDRATSLGLQGTPIDMSFGSPSDTYAHMKKTRTKPFRNADGVLIRKDGRPDMRSQSSAANLRKVHARRDGDPSHSPTGLTPTRLQHTISADAPDTPSPSPLAGEQGDSLSVNKKHVAIMQKIFPGGIDESRKENDYTRQVFDEGQDKVVHPRNTRRPSVVKHRSTLEQEKRVSKDLQFPERAESQDHPSATLPHSPSVLKEAPSQPLSVPTSMIQAPANISSASAE